MSRTDTATLGNVTSRRLGGRIGRFPIKIVRESSEHCKTVDRWRADCEACDFGAYGFILSSVGDEEFVSVVIREICDKAAKLREFVDECGKVSRGGK